MDEILTRRGFLAAVAALSAGLSSSCVLLRPGGAPPGGGFRVRRHKGDWPTEISWLLYQDEKRTVTGKQPLKDAPPQALETLVAPDKDSNLHDWNLPSLARLVPLKRIIEKHAAHYALNPVWVAEFFNFESLYDPTDINTFSDDYGLGQIKRQSERLAKRMGTDPRHRFYSPDLDKNKSVLDPHTNIIMATMLHRYNIERYGLTHSDQLYAVYVRGLPGLNKDGSLGPLTKDILPRLRERYLILEGILPLFRLDEQGLDRIAGSDIGVVRDAAALLKLYREDLPPQEAYRRELSHFQGSLAQGLKDDDRSVLLYDDCAVFANALRIAYRQDVEPEHKELLGIGSHLQRIVKRDEMRKRVERTVTRLQNAPAVAERILA